MKIPKLTPEESLRRIKLMMNYDSSRTLLEQTESPWDMVKKTGEVAGGAAALGAGVGAVKRAAKVGAGAAALKAISKYGKSAATALGSLFSKGAAGAAEVGTGVEAGTAGAGLLDVGAVSTVPAGEALLGAATTGVGADVAAAGGIGAGAVGGAILAGAAALAVVPLVLWLVDKDQAYPKVKKLFDYVKANKANIDRIDRGLDDDAIQGLSDDAYNAMKGLGTSNKLLFSVFDSLVTISDFSALITIFNEDHFDEGSGDLLEWLDDDIDISSTWNRIYVPLRNIVKKFAKGLADQNMPQQGQEQPTVNSTESTYHPCSGTYSFGCQSESVRKIQGCLGLVEDGLFGPKTEIQLEKLGKGYEKGFTDADVQTICGLASSLIQRAPVPSPVPTSQLKLSPLAPQVNTSTLPPPPAVA
jgi:hypothetical protein